MNLQILSFGQALPKRVIRNQELESLLNTTDEWIQQRSGIQQRHWVGPGETTLSMATEASAQALQRAQLNIDQIDLIIFGCLLSDYVFPGTGCLLQHSLGAKNNIPALDIRNQCSGFLYALNVARAFIESGIYRKILIVGSEIHSNRLNKTPEGRDVAVLFGDGAGACVVAATQDSAPQSSRIVDLHLASQGENANVLCVKEPASGFDFRRDLQSVDQANLFPHMEGRLVFKNAVERMQESLKLLLQRNSLQASDIDFVIAHQANMRINSMVLEQLKIPPTKTHNTIERFGNTTMATIPLTMGEAVQLGKIKRGDLVALVAFGAGFTWGSALLRY